MPIELISKTLCLHCDSLAVWRLLPVRKAAPGTWKRPAPTAFAPRWPAVCNTHLPNAVQWGQEYWTLDFVLDKIAKAIGETS